jgi:hypothetical protein
MATRSVRAENAFLMNFSRQSVRRNRQWRALKRCETTSQRRQRQVFLDLANLRSRALSFQVRNSSGDNSRRMPEMHARTKRTYYDFNILHNECSIQP